MKKICPKNPEHSAFVNMDDNFCYVCGAKLELKDRTCTCGNEYGISDKFCTQCGRPLQ